jgi:uncharacterized protein (DUF427 family)
MIASPGGDRRPQAPKEPAMTQPNPAPGYARHPGHKVAINPHPKRVRVKFHGRVVAETGHPLVVQESGDPPVFYIPRTDAIAAFLEPTDHHTHCPFKGDARYWSLTVDGKTAENAVWGYDAPYDEAAPLRGHIAFYPDRVDSIEELPVA